jgi:signal peptidase I
VTETKPRRRWFRWILRKLEHALALIGLGTLVYFGCFDLSRIASGSMKPTLQGESVKTGDLVLSERVSYWFRRPRRWELVAYRCNDGTQVMKRVIGLPGEKVQMRRHGQLVIDGNELAVPEKLSFLKYFPYAKLSEDKAVDCGDGYFVLGDYSFDSDDSRYNGPLSPGNIVARPWMIVAPAGRRGFVNP